MYKLKKIYIILIIQLTTTEIKMEKYRAGTTLNIFSEDNSIIGNIFNGFNGSKYIKKENFAHDRQYRIFNEFCLVFDSLKQYNYPEIHIDNKKSTSTPSKLFHPLNILEDHNLGVHHYYVNDDNFRYGIIKVCKVIEEQSVNIDLIMEKDFPKIYADGSYNILLNKTAVLRLRRDKETHYVSIVRTENCLIQIFVKEKNYCDHKDNSQSFKHEFFTNPVYKSQIIPINNNIRLAKEINSYYYLTDIDYSLFTFDHLRWNHQENIFNKFKDSSVLNLELKSLPEMRMSRKLTSLKLKNIKNLIDIIPGDLLNIEELVDHKSENISVRNILLDKDDNISTGFVSSNFERCFEKNKNGSFAFRDSEFSYFDSQMRKQNYGVDRGYVTEYVTCLKIIICSGLKNRNLHFSPLTLIKFSEKLKDNNRSKIFKNENIVLLVTEESETHYVTQTKKGNCLLQVFVYSQDLSYFSSNFKFNEHISIHQGRILSATNNRTLEKWAETFTEKNLRNIIGDEKNETMIKEIFHRLHWSDPMNNAFISISLDPL